VYEIMALEVRSLPKYFAARMADLGYHIVIIRDGYKLL
jgi:hypothetical protein